MHPAQYRPFHDLRSVPEAGSDRRGSDRWLVRRLAGQYSLAGTFQKIPFAENSFLQAGKGAGNTKK
jgi:hypothetical protein